MEIMIRFSKSILDDLKAQAKARPADVSSPIGDIFILKSAPIAGIRLNVPLEDYLQKISHQAEIVPTDDEVFPIIVNGEVTTKDGITFINGKEVTLLPKL